MGVVNELVDKWENQLYSLLHWCMYIQYMYTCCLYDTVYLAL